MKPLTSLILVILLAMAFMACGSMSTAETDTTTTEEAATDANSGDDVALAGARGLFDIVVNDNVDAVSGDNTDYKYFDIDERGRVSIRVRFMAPEVAGAVALHNDFGEVLYEEPVTVGQNEVYIEDFGVLPGRYYIRVFASEGATDYAIGREFSSSVTTATQVEEEPEPEVEERDEETDEEREARRARRRERRERREREANAEREPEPERVAEPEPEPEPEPEQVADAEPADEVEPIRATILTVREQSGGSGTTLILLGCGSRSGLSEGDRGRVGGSGPRATITRITGSDSCEAESSSGVGEIGSASYVSFNP